MLGKYGSIARDFMKENHPKEFAKLQPKEVQEIFSKANEVAKERLNIIMNQMLAKEPVVDPNNFWETVQHKEQIKCQAEEILINEFSLFYK